MIVNVKTVNNNEPLCPAEYIFVDGVAETKICYSGQRGGTVNDANNYGWNSSTTKGVHSPAESVFVWNVETTKTGDSGLCAKLRLKGEAILDNL